ncbi:MAG: 16S rRNA (guanine(527)-N(7))-methyltransferase RsmG [Oscillospiraceae bacterium]|jgi:16S rRNA (guanine527-N7)-methyltransferase
MAVTADKIISNASLCGIEVGMEKAELLSRYSNAVLEQNRFFNLTGITEENEFVTRHITDSLVCAMRPEVTGKVADVGTGAGFPGAVIGILKDEVSITLIEATGKKLSFASGMLDEMGIRCTAMHSRAEDAAKTMPGISFDCVTARGLAVLPAAMEYCLPLVKTGGYFIAMKNSGSYIRERSGRAEKLLGTGRPQVIQYTLPDGAEHELIIFKKLRQCSPGYPRRSDRIRKDPL